MMPGRPADRDTRSAAGLHVVGGGVIGLAIAWRCAQRGHQVTVHDPASGSGASHVAAGMLAPVGEAYFGERALSDLLVTAATRWADFAAELAPYGDIGYRTEGTLVVALTRDDFAEAERLWGYQAALGLPITPLRPGALRDREPALHPRVRGGAYAPGDHQVDPRRLMTALRAAAHAAGVRVVPQAVSELAARAGASGRAARPAGPLTVIAAGCGAARLTGLPVRPVKGQLLRLRAPAGEPGFRHVIRGFADGRRVYLVPRRDGEVVVGATEDERTDAVATAGAVLELLRAATDLVPELGEYELVEVGVGHRPGTPDNAPIMGWLAPGVAVATGHYRHGILLAPLTADLIADLVTTGVAAPPLALFAPSRFGTPTSATEGRDE